MRIKRLEIYGYGKWVDTTFSLEEEVHLFYGMNEAGKSTLMSFIHSILFGFPTRNSPYLRYEPRESSRYGGKVIASDARFGVVIIERIHGKVTGNVTVTLEDGTTGTDELLDSILYGMDRETYQNIFSFSLTEIENVHRLNKNQLSRYLLNIGAHGTEYYLELVDQFRADANKLYRPSGRVLDLNKQINVLEKQERRLADLEKRNESYLGLIEKNNLQNQDIQTIETKQKKLETELADLMELKKQWHIFEEINALDAEIQQVELPPLKEDGRYLLDEYKRELANLSEALQETERKKNAQKKTFDQPEMIENFEQHKEEVNALENNLPEIVEQLRDFENINEKRLETQKAITVSEQKLGIEHQSKYPTPFSKDERATVENRLSLYQEAVNKQQALTERIQVTENELNLKNQQLDQYEAIMWDNQELKEVETELNAEPKEMKATNKKPRILSGVLGLLSIIGAFLVEPPINWILGLVGIIALLLAMTVLKKKTPAVQPPNAFLLKEYEKQMTLKEEWRDGLGEVDLIQAKYQSQLQERDTWIKQQQEIVIQWQNLLEKHHLPGRLALEQAPVLFEAVQTLNALLEEDRRQSQKQAQLRKELEEKTAAIQTILDLRPGVSLLEKITAFRQYLNRLKAELTKEQEKLDHLNALTHETKQLEANHETTQEKIKNLIETASVKTEDEFVALYQLKETLDAKKSRLSFLKENTPSFSKNRDLPTKEEVSQRVQKREEKLDELATSKSQVIREQANTQLTIENLEKDGTYTEELQVFENQKAIAQRLMDDWITNKLAAGMIQETLSGVTKDRFQEIIADAETYFQLLTNEEYEKIVFQEEKLFVQHRNGQVVDVRVLSRGTSEPLYVAIRLAYIKNTQDVMELPIIMDDPFVNFDRTRQKNMYQLLEQLSKDLQIIYFTFDPVAKEYFTEKQITKLNL